METAVALKHAPVQATIPASDFDRAKRWYSEKLGLEPYKAEPQGAFYGSADGAHFLLFPSSGVSSGSHTQLSWQVEDAATIVNDLVGRGVVFEDYDMPGFDRGTHLATRDEGVSAWFKDSEGNLLAIWQPSR